MTDDKDEIKFSSEELETVAGGYISQGDDGSYNVYDNEEVSVIMHEIISRGVCPICEKKVDLPEDYFKKVIKASEHAKQCFS